MPALLQLHFLESLPFSLRLEGRGVLVVHAGLKPGRTLLRQHLRDLYCLRDCRPCGECAGRFRGPGLEVGLPVEAQAIHWVSRGVHAGGAWHVDGDKKSWR